MVGEDSLLFKLEDRQFLRRLATLGILGRQPAIAAQCKITKEEEERVATSILLQKMGTTTKCIEIIEEARKAHDEDSTTEQFKITVEKPESLQMLS